MNIANLERYVKQLNVLRERPLSLLNADDRQDIADVLASQLSPEWLTCDGELTWREVEHQRNAINRLLAELLSIDPELFIPEY